MTMVDNSKNIPPASTSIPKPKISHEPITSSQKVDEELRQALPNNGKPTQIPFNKNKSSLPIINREWYERHKNKLKIMSNVTLSIVGALAVGLAAYAIVYYAPVLFAPLATKLPN